MIIGILLGKGAEILFRSFCIAIPICVNWSKSRHATLARWRKSAALYRWSTVSSAVHAPIVVLLATALFASSVGILSNITSDCPAAVLHTTSCQIYLEHQISKTSRKPAYCTRLDQYTQFLSVKRPRNTCRQSTRQSPRSIGQCTPWGLDL